MKTFVTSVKENKVYVYGLQIIRGKKVQRWISFLVTTGKQLIASYDIKYSDV